ncbi:MAG: redox-sensing transcriptional repressor Rex [Bacteroidales bacterium]|nr:redox-sensing transcriptional repressor Rex [Bacteroidales bacterium]
MNTLPHKTVERLSRYRRMLLRYQFMEKPYIFSRDLAAMLKINPVHVRRDLMLLGISGSHSSGYDVVELIGQITQKLECRSGKHACIIGFGHTGRAALEMFATDFTPVKIHAIFDSSLKSVSKTFYDIPCYSMEKIAEVIEEQKITLAVFTEADDNPEAMINLLIALGIKGILNLTPVQLQLPEDVYLEEFDMITSMIKLAYFSGKCPGAGRLKHD